MLSFYDCDKNLSENNFNEIEKKLEVSFPASFKSHYSNGMEVPQSFMFCQ